jgi:hypothetical protein
MTNQEQNKAMDLLSQAIDLLRRDAPEGGKTDRFCKKAEKFLLSMIVKGKWIVLKQGK